MDDLKDEFRNDSDGFVGVISIEAGKERGIAVRPGATVWLSENEQIRTANAPRKEENNPFVNGALTLVSRGKQMANRRPIGSRPAKDDESEKAKAAAEKKKADEAAARKAEIEREKEATKAGADPAAAPKKETSAAETPNKQAPEGKQAKNEEVATPKAPAQGQQQKQETPDKGAEKPKAEAPASS